MSRRLVPIALAATLLAGCLATQLPAERVAAANYGPPPPANYEALVRAKLSRSLLDPYSAVFEFTGPPRKSYTTSDYRISFPETFGWAVCGTLNAKNRMGAYTGATPFLIMFRGDIIVFEYSDSYMDRQVLAAIDRACNR